MSTLESLLRRDRALVIGALVLVLLLVRAHMLAGAGMNIAHEPVPVFADIDFQFDLEGRRGRLFVKNVLDATVSPIRNPKTGEGHFISSPRSGDSSSLRPKWPAHHSGVRVSLSNSTKGGLQR
ncbi:MAG TPA: hypothetical protein VMW70_16660 [Burkholderiales bacterium]|nr:hypothetical protein [Burkholderiales bacterium]